MVNGSSSNFFEPKIEGEALNESLKSGWFAEDEDTGLLVDEILLIVAVWGCLESGLWSFKLVR